MSAEKIDQGGVRSTDPPWARLLFLVVEGREGQWWRAILLVVPLLLLVVALITLIGVIGWISGATGTGSLIAVGGLAWYRRRRNTVNRAIPDKR